MRSEVIKRDMDLFQQSVQKLSTGIGQAGSLWNDKKFGELTEKIRMVANQSRDVLTTGDKCCTQIDKFYKIADEKY